MPKKTYFYVPLTKTSLVLISPHTAHTKILSLKLHLSTSVMSGNTEVKQTYILWLVKKNTGKMWIFHLRLFSCVCVITPWRYEWNITALWFTSQTKQSLKTIGPSCRKHAAAPTTQRQYKCCLWHPEEYPIIKPFPRRGGLTAGRLANMYTGIPAVCLAVSTVMYNSFDPRKKGTNHDFN